MRMLHGNQQIQTIHLLKEGEILRVATAILARQSAIILENRIPEHIPARVLQQEVITHDLLLTPGQG